MGTNPYGILGEEQDEEDDTEDTEAEGNEDGSEFATTMNSGNEDEHENTDSRGLCHSKQKERKGWRKSSISTTKRYKAPMAVCMLA